MSELFQKPGKKTRFWIRFQLTHNYSTIPNYFGIPIPTSGSHTVCLWHCRWVSIKRQWTCFLAILPALGEQCVDPTFIISSQCLSISSKSMSVQSASTLMCLKKSGKHAYHRQGLEERKSTKIAWQARIVRNAHFAEQYNKSLNFIVSF